MIHKIFNSERELDGNGYLNVKKSPILRSGILQYQGRELLGEGKTHIDGVEIDLDKIYNVRISDEELEKGADSFKMKPLQYSHTWLGEDGEDAKGFQEGSLGENWSIENGMLYFPLVFTGKDTVEKVTNKEVEELSASYENKLTVSNEEGVDFDASDIRGNHVALVERGRCGSNIKVLNSMEKEEMVNKTKTKSMNGIKLLVDDKEVDLSKFIDEEKEEGGHDESIAQNEVSEDKRKLIDEIGGMIKDKVDEEVWRTIIKKAEELAYNGSETSKADNEEKEEVKEKKEIDETKLYNSILSKVNNSVSENNKAISRAYNSAREVMGDFNAFGLSEKDIYTKALNHLGVDLSGSETSKELEVVLKACGKMSRVDNSFSYSSSSASDEIEINI